MIAASPSSASASEQLGTLFAFLFFTGLQVWPLIYLAWFVQTAVGNAGCSDLPSMAHLTAKIIVWADIAAVIIMFFYVVFRYGRAQMRLLRSVPPRGAPPRAWRAAASSTAAAEM